MKFEGKNAVFELLNSNITVEKVVCLDKTQDVKIREIISLAKNKSIRVDFVNKQALDNLSETGHHQGIIALATEFVYSDLDDVLKKQNKDNDIVVILDGVLDPHNLGSVLRVADCAGVGAVIIPKNRSASVNETVIRVSAGASAHVPVVKVTNLTATIKQLKDSGYWVYAADMDGEDLYKTSLKGKIAIVVGGEGEGVSKLVKKESDGVVRIPMFGQVNSLNASVSAAIVVYEAVRQQNNQ